jgi:hypothetical protein
MAPLTRREQLLASMQAQREEILAQLQGRAIAPGGYPRSLTMQVLTHHPDMLVRTALNLFGLWRSIRHGARRD